MSLVLTSDELEELTGRKRAAAQRRALEKMRLPFFTDPEGHPRVLRVLVEQLGGVKPGAILRAPEPEPEVRP